MVILACSYILPARDTANSNNKAVSVSNRGANLLEEGNFPLYILCTLDGGFTALDGKSGQTVWTVDTGKPAFESWQNTDVHRRSPTGTGKQSNSDLEAVIPGLDGSLYMKYADSNALEKLPLRIQDVPARAIRAGENVLLGISTPDIISLDAATGRILNSHRIASTSTAANVYLDRECPSGAPEGTLHLTRSRRSVVSLHPQTGNPLWNASIYDFDASFVGKMRSSSPNAGVRGESKDEPVVDFVADLEGRLMCRHEGHTLWTHHSSAPVVALFSLWDGEISDVFAAPPLDPDAPLAADTPVRIQSLPLNKNDHKDSTSTSSGGSGSGGDEETTHRIYYAFPTLHEQPAALLEGPGSSHTHPGGYRVPGLIPGRVHAVEPVHWVVHPKDRLGSAPNHELPPSAPTAPNTPVSLALGLLSDVFADPWLPVATVLVLVGSAIWLIRPRRQSNSPRDDSDSSTTLTGREDYLSSHPPTTTTTTTTTTPPLQPKSVQLAVIRSLYDDFSHACIHCGLRFAAKDEWEQHQQHCPTQASLQHRQWFQEKWGVRTWAPAVGTIPLGLLERSGIVADQVGNALSMGTTVETVARGSGDAVGAGNSGGTKVLGRLMVTPAVLGYGCLGSVVFAGTLDGRQVAVKRMLSTFYGVAQREVSLLISSDSHPNVVRYYSQEVEGEFIYVALELCACNLHDYIAQGSMGLSRIGVPTLEGLKILRGIMSGLEHVHELHMVHRDIKPSNILLSQAGVAKIADMGLGRRLEGKDASFETLTVGSSGWQAPEVLNCQSMSQKIDVFSLGCLIYFCVTNGEHPFGSRFERDVNIASGNYDVDLLLDAPEAFDLITQMIEHDPSRRPALSDIRHHPFFWDDEKRLSFLQDFSDRLEVESAQHWLVVAFEKRASTIFGQDWLRELPEAVLNELRNFRKYKSFAVRDLLRVIRNKRHHYRDLPAEVQEILGPLPSGYLRFFTRRYPSLLMECYLFAVYNLSGEDIFRRYLLD